MEKIDEIETKVNEITTSLKLLEFNYEFQKFKTMVMSGFSVFCVLFAAYFGYNYYEIPKHIEESIDKYIGKSVQKRIETASANADKIINASEELKNLKDQNLKLKNELEEINKRLPTIVNITLKQLQSVAPNCDKDLIYARPCINGANEYCQKKIDKNYTVASIREGGVSGIVVACFK